MTDDELRETARNQCPNEREEDIQVDSNAKVSRIDDGSGAWVHAWVWVPSNKETEQE